jgi:hypothetical protein
MTFVTNTGAGGPTFASDDIAGVKWPQAKSSWGPTGTAADTSTTNPLPVQAAAVNFVFSTLNTSTFQSS